MIHLRETDATGVLYFAQQLRLALEVFEDYLKERGQPLGALISEKDYLMPIVHTEADYYAPLRVGDEVLIDLTLEKVGTSSFTLHYRLLDSVNSQEKGQVKIVHVTTSKETNRAVPIPEELRECLEDLVVGKKSNESPAR